MALLNTPGDHKQTTGKKVIDELEQDLEQAVEANRSTTPTGP
jgi:hypothetical protein